MTASAPTKKAARPRLPMMSLDMRGRLVADQQRVFASTPIRAEIMAAITLGKALAAVRKNKKRSEELAPRAAR